MRRVRWRKWTKEVQVQRCINISLSAKGVPCVEVDRVLYASMLLQSQLLSSTEFCVRFSRIMFFSFVVSAYKWLYSTSSVQCINIRTAKVSYLSKIICHHQGLNLM